jgi:phage terminase small subunit
MQLDLDLQVFLAYCCATGDLADVRAKWQGDGAPATVQRPSGAREHPVIATMRTLGADILKYGHQLGLTPRSRKVLGVELGAMPADPARDSAESAEDRRIAATYFNH